MSDPADILLVFATVPDAETGRTIAAHLVEYRLAACVNLIPGIESTYRWQDAVQHDSEVLLIAKTTLAGYARLQETIVRLHPYELPEVVAVSLQAGLPAYLNWVISSVETNQ